MAGQPKRSSRACRHAWRFTSGCGQRSRPLSASRSNAHRWIVFGLVQRTCSLAKFGRPSASLATTSPSSTAALAGSSRSSSAMEGNRSVKSCLVAAVDNNARAYLVGLHAVAVELDFVQLLGAGRHSSSVGNTQRTIDGLRPMQIPALMQMVQVLFSFLVFSSWPRESGPELPKCGPSTFRDGPGEISPEGISDWKEY